MGLAWANQEDPEPFCPLIVVLGIEPESVEFDDAKRAAEHIKNRILPGDIEVAVWEFPFHELSSTTGPRLAALDPIMQDTSAVYAHKLSSSLSLAISPYELPHCKGSGGCFFRRGDDVLLLTAAHVARPPSTFGYESLQSEDDARHRREEIIVLGDHGYDTAVASLASGIESNEFIQDQAMRVMGVIRNTLGHEPEYDDEMLLDRIRREEGKIQDARFMVRELQELQVRAAELESSDSRRIGFNLYVDSRGAAEGHMVNFDWAMIQLNEDAFDWDGFKGNKIYIGELDAPTYRRLMYPWPPDRANYQYPPDQLLPIRGTVPLEEIRKPIQLNEHGNPGMPVIKNGAGSGTTVGRSSPLMTKVRRRGTTSLEATFVSYGRPEAFSTAGDSGSLILDRSGRIVALLTFGGGSLANGIDVTLGTPYASLEPVIKDAPPGIQLLE